jgi:hypothetical protein
MRLTVIEWHVMWQTTALAPDVDERKALAEILDVAYPYTVHGGLPAAADAVIAAGFHRDGPSYTDAANERDAARAEAARLRVALRDKDEAFQEAAYDSDITQDRITRALVYLPHDGVTAWAILAGTDE